MALSFKPIKVSEYVKLFPVKMRGWMKLVMKKLVSAVDELEDDSGRIRYKYSENISYSPLINLLFYFFGGFEEFRNKHEGYSRSENTPSGNILRPPDAEEFYQNAIKLAKIPARYLRLVMRVKRRKIN